MTYLPFFCDQTSWLGSNWWVERYCAAVSTSPRDLPKKSPLPPPRSAPSRLLLPLPPPIRLPSRLLISDEDCVPAPELLPSSEPSGLEPVMLP